MNKRTKQRRINALIEAVENHPQKEELLALMREQVQDDKTFYGDNK
jgi:hypothetical protein